MKYIWEAKDIMDGVRLIADGASVPAEIQYIRGATQNDHKNWIVVSEVGLVLSPCKTAREMAKLLTKENCKPLN